MTRIPGVPEAWLVAAFCFCMGSVGIGSHAAAQGFTFVPHAASYAVTGEMQGREMEPWEAKVNVRDSMVDGKRVIAITYNTLRATPPSTYSETTIFDPSFGRALQFLGRNNGRAPGTYDLRFASGRLQGVSRPEGSGEERIDIAVPESAVPESSAPFVVAARPLKDGDSIAVKVFTYQSSSARVFPHEFSGIVRAGSFQRSGATAPEPVWIVTGGSSYPAKYVVAQSDRRVLQVVLPQGSVGTQTDTYTGPQRE